jgi:SPP1 family predicted phage head-tail adaptor
MAGVEQFKPPIGSLRHRIQIQQATETRATDGSISQAWSNFAAARAEIVPLNGSESYVAQGLSAGVHHRITTRYIPGVVPKMRVLWGDREFDIVTVRNIDERNRWLVMQCEESV